MKYAITVLFALSFIVSHINSQNYISLNQYHGVDISNYHSNQDEIAGNIIQIFPLNYHDSIVVVSSSAYLHSSKFTSDYQSLVDTMIETIESLSKYYIAIIRFSNETSLNKNITLKLNLPPIDSLTPCFDENILMAIEASISDQFNSKTYDNMDSYYYEEHEVLKLLQERFYHLLNCCNLQRSHIEECNECTILIEDAISLLRNNGYCDINSALESILEFPLNVSIENKNYSKINSDYNIVFYNSSENLEYSLTDGLENYRLEYTDTNEFSINVFVYDNDISTLDIYCFEQLEEPIRSPSSYSTYDNIYVIIDQGKPYVMAKTIMWEPLLKEEVILYNNSSEPNSIVHPIMESAYDDAKNIYIKNGYDILDLTILESESEYNNLLLNKREIFYNFVKHPEQFSCPYGRTFFDDPYDMTMSKEKDCTYGCFVNYGRFQWEKHPNYAIGYDLAHEILHALTIKGSLLMDLPITKPNLSFYFPGGHFNWEDNLLKEGNLIGEFPEPKPNLLHPNEIINKEARYFLIKFVYSHVDRP